MSIGLAAYLAGSGVLCSACCGASCLRSAECLEADGVVGFTAAAAAAARVLRLAVGSRVPV